MVYEELQTFIYPIMDIAAITATIFAVILFINMIRSNEQGTFKKSMKIIFGLLAIGLVLTASAELIWDGMQFFMGIEPELGLPDILWTLSYIFTLAGYSLFARMMINDNPNEKNKIFAILGVGLLALFIAGYLIKTLILGNQEGESMFEMFLDIYYPIISAMVVMAAFTVFLFFKKIPQLGFPLMLLGVSKTCDFIGNIAYTYYSWNEIYGLIGVIADVFFTLDYVLGAVAFYMLFRLLLFKDTHSSLST